MPIIPNFLERLVFRFNVAPAFMLDYLGAQAFRANTVAFKLGVFDALKSGPRTAADLARQTAVDVRGMTLLLQTLEALGYVKRNGDDYALKAALGKWLPIFSAPAVTFFEQVVFDQWQHLEESIRLGRSAMPVFDGDGERVLQAGMIAMARMASDEIAARVKLPSTARRLIDLGGGHGLYSIKLCERHPALSATIFDAPGPLEAARTMIAAEQMDGRISLQEGNFLTDDIGSGYDVALLFNVIHYHLPDTNTELLRKVMRALNPGGVVVIMDQIPGRVSGPTVRALIRLQALHIFNAVSGQTYTFKEIADWLVTAGLKHPRKIDLRTSMGHALVLGTKTS